MRARTIAACEKDAIQDLILRAYERHHARAHLAKMAPERFAALQKEWK